MSSPKAPKLQFIEATETSIAVEFKPEAGAAYILQWKEHSQSWESGAQSKPVTSKKAEAEDLEPGTTYCIRLAFADGTTGEPGPELILDTEQVGCTPKADKSCCVVS